MTNRRRYGKPIVLPLIFVALLAWDQLRDKPQWEGPYYRIEPSCQEYAANVPADTGISEWCMRKRGY